MGAVSGPFCLCVRFAAMSYGVLGDAAIPNRLRVEYAPTGRAGCKACGSAIAEMTPKVGVKVRSPFHDGFDIHWYHVRCGHRNGSSVHDFVGFQRLKWSDQCAFYERIHGCAPASSPQHKEAQEMAEMLWQVQGAIAGVPKKALKEALELNQRLVSDKATPLHLKHTLADGLLNGRLPPCPWCSCEALEQAGRSCRERQTGVAPRA